MLVLSRDGLPVHGGEGIGAMCTNYEPVCLRGPHTQRIRLTGGGSPDRALHSFSFGAFLLHRDHGGDHGGDLGQFGDSVDRPVYITCETFGACGV
jgi:hypothetical protein